MIREWIDRGHSEECGWTRHRHGADCHPDCPTCHGQQLKNAGLLADPTTSRTDAEQAVIDAAIEWRDWMSRQSIAVTHHAAPSSLIAAVDRLAAPGPKEATP